MKKIKSKINKILLSSSLMSPMLIASIPSGINTNLNKVYNNTSTSVDSGFNLTEWTDNGSEFVSTSNTQFEDKSATFKFGYVILEELKVCQINTYNVEYPNGEPTDYAPTSLDLSGVKKEGYDISFGIATPGYGIGSINKTRVVDVILPKDTVSIGDSVFNTCTNMTSITLNEGLKEIGQASFQNCSALKEITLPTSLESIGDYAFYGCTNLFKDLSNKPLVFHENLSQIKASAFSSTQVSTFEFKGKNKNIVLGTNAFNTEAAKTDKLTLKFQYKSMQEYYHEKIMMPESSDSSQGWNKCVANVDNLSLSYNTNDTNNSLPMYIGIGVGSAAILILAIVITAVISKHKKIGNIM